jgi:hypothetical protein
MKFHAHWFGLTCAALLLATLVACPTATTTPPAATAQTITFTALTDKSVGDPAVTLVATTSSGLAVSFSSLTAATCTLADGKVNPIAIGKCTVAADQPGNANYAAAPRVENSFTITKPCVPVVLNNNALTTWTLKRVTTGNAFHDPLEVGLTGVTGSSEDTNGTDPLNVDTTGAIQGCNNLTLTLTLSHAGAARGILYLTGKISLTAANQDISGTYTSSGIQNNEAGTFNMTHN